MTRLFPMMAALLCVAGTPAAAQAGNTVPNGEARKTATQFSACLVNQARRSVRTLITAPYSVATFDKDFGRLHSSTQCLTGRNGMVSTLTFPRITMRSFLFDALYRSDFAKAPAATDFSAVQPLTYPVEAGLGEEEARPYLVNMALGDCVSRQAPAAARAFLLTRVETAEETAALQVLAPAFQNCLPQGIELKLTRWKARATIAEPLYRLTQAQVKP